MNISDVTGKADGEGIISIKGKLKAVYETKRGYKNGKAWSFQDLVLEDPTGEIKVTVQGKDAQFDIPESMKGKNVVISSYKSARGWVGVYAYDHEYPEGVKTRKIKVTKTGDIREDNDNPAPHAAETHMVPTSKVQSDIHAKTIQYLNACHIVERLANQQMQAAEAQFGIPSSHENLGGKIGGVMRYLNGLISSQPTEPIWEQKELEW